MNRAWFNLWSTLISNFAALPKRLTSAQVEYIDDMLGRFEETGREMGNLLLHAEEEVGETLQKNAVESRRRMREGKEKTGQAARGLQRTAESRRQKNEAAKGRRSEQSNQDRTH